LPKPPATSLHHQQTVSTLSSCSQIQPGASSKMNMPSQVLPVVPAGRPPPPGQTGLLSGGLAGGPSTA
jgi:hypothetical protein